MSPNPASNSQKRSIGEKVLSFILDGPLGTTASKTDRELRKNFEEDKLDFPRTEKEERERQERIKKRQAIVGGHGDIQKGAWGGGGGGFVS
jgi:hypothetical protein